MERFSTHKHTHTHTRVKKILAYGVAQQTLPCVLYVKLNDTCPCGESANFAHVLAFSSNSFVVIAFLFLFFYTTIKGSDWMPFLCGAIVHSHQSFLHVRLTLQTLLVTLPHPHQRLPPERLSGILAEIYSPHLYASETCWSKVISLPLLLFLCSMCEVGQHFNDPFIKLLHLQR